MKHDKASRKAELESKKVGRPTQYNYEVLLSKYSTGQYSIRELAREYNIPRSTLHQYINEKGAKKNTDAVRAVKKLTDGMNALERLKDPKNGNGEIVVQNADGSIRVVDNTLVLNEVIEIIKAKNPVFAKTLQSFSSKLLMKAFELLDKTDKPSDLNHLAGVLEKVNNTLQVIPKPPAIAQQFNIGKESEASVKREIKKIVFEINKREE